MNIVRLITISAGSVGLAIAAGTLFQPDTAEAPGAEIAQADVPAPVSLAGGMTAGASGTMSGISGLADRALQTDTVALSAPVSPAPPETAPPETAPTTIAHEMPGDDGRDSPLLANITEIEAAETAGGSPLSPEEMSALLAEASACAVWVVVTPEPAAMLDLSLYAPCDADQPILISHGPMRLSGQVGPDGMLMMSLPALSPQAEVAVEFSDGRRQTDMTDVPDFGMFPRLVVQWNGPAVLDLHAYAGGARWGEPGHVQAGGPVSAATGFVSVVPSGDSAQVRIYTFPAGITPESGLILLEAEVAVTEAVCGQALDAQVHMVRDDAPVGRRDIRVDMPPCDATGGFVLLPDLLPGDLPGMSALN